MGKRIIITLALSLLLCACGSSDKDIIVMDLGELSPVMRDSLEAWKAAHPDVKIKERKRLWDSDIASLSVMGTKFMPDVFITDGLIGRFLAQSGKVFNLNDYTVALPGLAYGGTAWAFPAQRETVMLVIYDGDSTEEPEFLSAEGLFSACLSDSLGQQWLQHIVAADKQAAFTDRFFVERLSDMQETMQERPFVTVNDFVEGRCTSLLVGGEDLYELLDRVKSRDVERYARLSFRPYAGDAVLRGYDWGLFVSAALSRNHKKLFNCLTLCSALSPPGGDEPIDDTMRRLREMLDSAAPAAIPTHYISSGFWNYVRLNVFSRLASTDKTIQEIAAILQDVYEQDYLNTGR